MWATPGIVDPMLWPAFPRPGARLPDGVPAYTGEESRGANCHANDSGIAVAQPEPEGRGSGCGSGLDGQVRNAPGRGRPGACRGCGGATFASPTAPWSWCPSTGSATPTAGTCSRWPSRPRAASGPRRRRNPQPAARTPAGTFNAGRAAIEQELAKRTKVDFAQTPLDQVLTYLEESHQLSILLDRKALDSAGVDAHQPVTLQLAGEPLEQVLDGVLKPLKLTWIIRDEVLSVTTPEEADGHTETRVYKVLQRVANPTAFLSEIKSKVAPKSWDSAGGPGSLSAWPLGAIVVTQTCGVHRQLEQQYGKIPPGRLGAGPAVRPPAGAPPHDQGPAHAAGQFRIRRDAAPRRRPLGRGELPHQSHARRQGGIAGAGVTIRLRRNQPGVRNSAFCNRSTATGLAVTTPEAESRPRNLGRLNVRDLIYAIPGDGEGVLTHVTPQMWSQVGGPATLKPAEGGGADDQAHLPRPPAGGPPDRRPAAVRRRRQTMNEDLLRAIELALGDEWTPPIAWCSSTNRTRPPRGFTPCCTRSKAIRTIAATGPPRPPNGPRGRRTIQLQTIRAKLK